MEEEKQECDKVIEAMLIIDLDPSLSLFKPNCTFEPILARIEMGLQS